MNTTKMVPCLFMRCPKDPVTTTQAVSRTDGRYLQSSKYILKNASFIKIQSKIQTCDKQY